eukprot:3581165-Amphidinium_carterae.1
MFRTCDTQALPSNELDATVGTRGILFAQLHETVVSLARFIETRVLPSEMDLQPVFLKSLFSFLAVGFLIKCARGPGKSPAHQRLDLCVFTKHTQTRFHDFCRERGMPSIQTHKGASPKKPGKNDQMMQDIYPHAMNIPLFGRAFQP